MASASSQAGFLAKQGLSLLYNATVTGVNAVSTGISKACRHYADVQEREKIEAMRKAGKRSGDVIFAALQRLLHLEMAGYHHEVAAVSQKVAAKLIQADDRSSVEHQTLQALSRTLTEACRQHGVDVTSSVKGGRLVFQGLEDFLNSSRMGTDHYDRDKLVTELYFAFLFAQDDAQGSIQRIEAAMSEAVERLISGQTRNCMSPVSPLSPTSGAALSPSKIGGGGGMFSTGSVCAASANDLPSYARPDTFTLPKAAAPAAALTTIGSSSRGRSTWGISASSSAPRKAADKHSPFLATRSQDEKTSGGLTVVKRVACCIARAAAEAEARRQRGLQEAQEVVQREQEKGSRAAAAMGGGGGRSGPMGGGRPIIAPSQGSYGAASSGVGSGAGPWGSPSGAAAAGSTGGWSGAASGMAGAKATGGPTAGSAAVSNWKGGSCSAVPLDGTGGAYNGGMSFGGAGEGAGGYGASAASGKVVGGTGKSSGGWGGNSGGGGKW